MSKKVLALVLALVMVIAMLPTVAFAADFADTKGHWAEAQIDRWTEAGVVEGNGTSFNPNGSMTRAEAAKTFANLLKLSTKDDLAAYTDVPTAEWKAEALAKAVAKGIIKGMTDTTLVPDGTLTREQMFVMIGRALGIEEKTTATKTFTDGTETSSWAEGYINALADMGVINGVGNNMLNPTADINRASVMKALDNLIGGYANEDGQTVEIVPGKITLIVADEVKVEGEADPTTPIVVAGEAKTVDLEGVTVTEDAAPVVQVQVEEVAIENAPEGTTVAAPAEATDVTVNGETVEAGKEVVVPETKPETQTTPPAPPAPAPAPDEDEEETTYTIIFDPTHGTMKLNDFVDKNGTCYGGENTCWGGENTCYGGENLDTASWCYFKVTTKGSLTLNDIPVKVNAAAETEGNGTFILTPKSDGWTGYKFAGWFVKKVAPATDSQNANDYVAATGLTDTELSKYIDDAGVIVFYAAWQSTAQGGSTCYGGQNSTGGNYGGTTAQEPAPTSGSGR